MLFKEKSKLLKDKISQNFNNKFGSNAFKLIFGVGLVAILSCVALILLIKAFYNKSLEYLNYSEVSKTDYTVNLKKNDYYDVNSLPSGMNYIASLIKDIDINFDYSFTVNKNVNYSFVYYVEAITRVYGDKDKTSILYEKKEDLTEKKSITKLDTSFSTFKKKVTIDYAKFNNFVNSFKTSYGLTSDSDVTIILHIIGTASNSAYEDDIEINGEAKVVIPLTEQTISVGIDSNNIKEHGSLSKKADFNILNVLYVAFAGLIIIIDLLILYKLILIVDKYLKSISKYQKKLNKILREYDSIIANVENNLDTNKYQFVKVSSFEELLDVHDNVGSPILFREVVPGKCSHFIIISDNVLYRFVLKDEDNDI